MATVSTDDLTIIYYSANVIPLHFASATYNQLLKAAQGLPLIVVSQQPMPIDEPNIVVDFRPSHLNIYRQALIGAQAADTKYIALAEDDVLYSPAHFKYRPSDNKFAYNLSAWSIYTWGEPVFTHKGTVRRNLNSLICDRLLFIEAMQERFLKYSEDAKVNLSIWAEPGKYESQLGVKVCETEIFFTNPPNIIFSHHHELSFNNLGIRKKLGEYRALEIPIWGRAQDVLKIYSEVE